MFWNQPEMLKAALELSRLRRGWILAYHSKTTLQTKVVILDLPVCKELDKKDNNVAMLNVLQSMDIQRGGSNECALKILF